MLRSIYTYLDEIDFEKRVKEHSELIRNTERIDVMACDLFMLNWVFYIISDIFDKIYEDVETVKSQDDCQKEVTNKQGRDSEVLISAIEELERVKKLYARAKWWLNEIVENHRFTPITTAEMAIKELKELEK